MSDALVGGAEEPERVAIGIAFPGATVVPLPEGYLATDVFAIVKSVDSDGDVNWSLRVPENYNEEEFLGVLVTQLDLMRRRLLDEWLAE